VIPAQAIAGARVILNDPAGPSPRWSDATLLGYFNDFMRSLAVARGELFTGDAQVTLAPGERQSVSRVDTLGIVEVLKNGNGEYVREVSKDEMSVQTRGWGKSTKGHFKVWMRAANDPFRFSIYPPAKGGETALVAVTALPADVQMAAINTDNGHSNAWRAGAENFIAGRALTINTNAADTAKGAALLQVAAAFTGVGTA
jgi:hypothetical protein